VTIMNLVTPKVGALACAFVQQTDLSATLIFSKYIFRKLRQNGSMDFQPD
jgi:hypothetical protein